MSERAADLGVAAAKVAKAVSGDENQEVTILAMASERSAPGADRANHEGDETETRPDLNGTKIRVENLHYDLTKEDLEELFSQMGPLLKLDILYDRAGRSTGTAFVTYESYHDARAAIKDFDGANANGQPIRLSIVPPHRQRNPFDSAVVPGRPLAERVTLPPGGTARSHRTGTWRTRRLAKVSIVMYPVDGTTVPAARCEAGAATADVVPAHDVAVLEGRGERGPEEMAEKELEEMGTQEELDAEMDNYFGGGGGGGDDQTATNGNGPAVTGQVAEEDIDMIE
ncbi:hypothetical protein SLS53_002769 [Cytospora paraplurivora]|uniref:RRM domain-containing protein n=1 Tax=Cytospora paraplurivora TaxID=2898453 RepID=A0AAN9UJA2_9PEZI